MELKLDKKERLNLSYQLKILEKLYPEEREHYANHRKAIEDGYELHYSWLTEHISDDVLTREESREVLDILEMYSDIYFSYEALKPPTKITHEFIKFPGFDGNNESKRLDYTIYFIEDLGRFQFIKELTKSHYNSPQKMIPKYQKMLEKFKIISTEERKNLSEEQIIDLIKTLGE